MLLRPSPMTGTEQLVALRGMSEARGPVELGASAPEYLNFRDDLPASMTRGGLADQHQSHLFGQPERLQPPSSAALHLVLGVTPVLGRDIHAGGRRGPDRLCGADFLRAWQRRSAGSVPSSAVRTPRRRSHHDRRRMPLGFRHPMERGASTDGAVAPIDLASPGHHLREYPPVSGC